MLRGAGDQSLKSSNRAKQGVGKCRKLNDPGVSRNLHVFSILYDDMHARAPPDYVPVSEVPSWRERSLRWRNQCC